MDTIETREAAARDRFRGGEIDVETYLDTLGAVNRQAQAMERTLAGYEELTEDYPSLQDQVAALETRTVRYTGPIGDDVGAAVTGGEQSGSVFVTTGENGLALATLTAPALLALGALMGGGWAWAGLLWMTLLTAVLDEAVAWTLPSEDPAAEFPRADALSLVLVVAQIGLLGLVIQALGQGRVAGIEALALALGTGLFLGQVGNSNAHELIHRSTRRLRRAGVLAYVSVLHGQHVSGHLLVHHVHVGTRADPNSARWGEGLYRFFLRAWPGELRHAFAAERARDRATGRPPWHNPFAAYLLGGLAFLALALWLGGPVGLAWYLGLAAFAQLQLMTSDYVQHYGLRRETGPDGRPVDLCDGRDRQCGPPVADRRRDVDGRGTVRIRLRG